MICAPCFASKADVNIIQVLEQSRLHGGLDSEWTSSLAEARPMSLFKFFQTAAESIDLHMGVSPRSGHPTISFSTCPSLEAIKGTVRVNGHVEATLRRHGWLGSHFSSPPVLDELIMDLLRCEEAMALSAICFPVASIFSFREMGIATAANCLANRLEGQFSIRKHQASHPLH